LEPDDPSPFLGNIPPGTTVSSIENNLYKAPIFRHTPRETDFLLIKYVMRELKRKESKHKMKLFALTLLN
jgi:hypothetical protein